MILRKDEYILKYQRSAERIKYKKIVEYLKQIIISEKPNSKLPSIRELSSSLNISSGTVQKAYKELEIQGYIYSVQGKGKFSNPQLEIDTQARKQEIKYQLYRIIEESLYLGITKEELTYIANSNKYN